MEFENQNNQSGRPCDVCGERPAVVDVLFVAGTSQRQGGLCEQCAQEKGVETGVAVLKSPLSTSVVRGWPALLLLGS